MAEGAHRPGPEEGWEESWYFDFATPGGELAGYSRLGLRPGEGVAWWWTAVVGRDRPFVLVRDHEVDPPKPGSLEIRGSGLWAEPVCETPFEHWSVGLEALAVALDDPIDAYRGERGDPVPLGLDLEWEDVQPPTPAGAATGYERECTVHGEVLIGRARLAVAGTGRRSHDWGPRPWWAGPAPSAGEVDDRGLIAGADVLAHAPLAIPDPRGGPPSRLARALRRDLRWVERLQPASSTTG